MQLDVPNPRWMADAACTGTPIDLWFSTDHNTAPSRTHERAARDLCLTCPVIGDCGTWIITMESRAVGRKYGIYAATTPHDRHRHHDTISTMTPDQYADWIATYARTKKQQQRHARETTRTTGGVSGAQAKANPAHL